MKKTRQLIIGLTITLGALYYTLHNISLDELIESFKGVHYFYLVPATVFIILSFIFRIFRWQILLSPVRKIPLFGLFSPMMVGYMGNILPARAGDIFRPYLISQRYEVPFSSSIATIVLERLFDVLGLLVIFIWCFIFYSDLFNSGAMVSGVSVETLAVKFGELATLVLCIILVLIYFLLYQEQRFLRGVHAFSRHLPARWHDKVEFVVQEFRLGVVILKSFPALIKIVLFTALEWLANIFSMYPLYWAYELENKTLGSLLILTVMIAIFVTILPTPALLGAFNAGVLVALHEIMHESELAAVGFGMVGYGLNFLVIFLGGFYFVLHDHLSLSQLMKTEVTRELELKRLEHEN